MRMIEPCCYHRQLEGLIDECVRTKGAAHFFSYSDWTFPDMLGTLSAYSRKGEICIAMVRADLPLIEAARKALSRKSGQEYAVRSMVLVTQPPASESAFDQRGEIRAQLGKYVREGRLAVCEDNIGFRCVMLRSGEHSLVIQGSLNTQKSGAMQMFTLTASPDECDNVREMFAVKERTKRIAGYGDTDKV